MQAPYGSWPSPVSGDVVARDPGWPYSQVLTSDGAVYWIESRPEEDGRDVIVVWRPGAEPVDVIAAGWCARTRVHEYGGGQFTVHDGTVYFCEDADQRIYAIRDGEPVPLTPEPATKHAVRYADLHVTPDGTRLAWLAWDHPRMPWEGSELHTIELKEGLSLFSNNRRVSGPEEARGEEEAERQERADRGALGVGELAEDRHRAERGARGEAEEHAPQLPAETRKKRR
jgi:hypothetical protein